MLTAEALQLIVDSVTDYAIVTLDVEGRITAWNPAAERIFGFRADEAVGRHASLIFTESDRARDVPEEEMRRARETGRAEDDRWHTKKSGELLFLSGVLTALRPGGTFTGYVKIARDVTQRRKLENALRRAHHDLERRVSERTEQLAHANARLEEELRERRATEERIKGLFNQLVTVQEDERRRIARDIHDQLGQQMTALRLNLASLQAECPDEPLAKKVEATRRLAEDLDHAIDSLTWGLRPTALDHLGLAGALEHLVHGWSARFGAAVEFQAVDVDAMRLPPHVEINVYRIVQEALHNVYKHASPQSVAVVIARRGDTLVVMIEDDGRGFDARAVRAADGAGMGLMSMRERAALAGGELEIESSPGAGTTIYVRVPIV